MKIILAILFACLPAWSATIYPINIGAAPNDATGDTLRTAFGKVNTNFANLDLSVSNIVAGTVVLTNNTTTNAVRLPILDKFSAGAWRFNGIEQGSNAVLYLNGSNIVINGQPGAGGGAAGPFNANQFSASGSTNIKDGAVVTNLGLYAITTHFGIVTNQTDTFIRGATNPKLQITSSILPQTLELDSQSIGTLAGGGQPYLIVKPEGMTAYKFYTNHLDPILGATDLGSSGASWSTGYVQTFLGTTIINASNATVGGTNAGNWFQFPQLGPNSLLGLDGNRVAVAVTNVYPRTVFMATNGNDATGLRGEIRFPFLTLGAAVTNAMSGDQILIGPGIFNHGGGLVQMGGNPAVTITNKSLTIRGSGKVSVLNFTNICDGIFFIGSGFEISDVTIAGTRTTNWVSLSNMTYACGLNIGSADHVTMRRLYVTNWQCHGVGAWSSALTVSTNAIVLENSEAEWCGGWFNSFPGGWNGAGFEVEGFQCNALRVRNCVFGIEAFPANALSTPILNTVIQNCSVENTVSLGIGAGASNFVDMLIQGNVVRNEPNFTFYASNQAAQAIGIFFSAGAIRPRIIGNSVSGKSIPIRLVSGSAASLIEPKIINNVVDGAMDASGVGHGIFVGDDGTSRGPVRPVIAGNQVYRTYSDGIALVGGYGATIDGNYIQDCDTNNAGAYGIDIYSASPATVSNSVVRNNYVIDTKTTPFIDDGIIIRSGAQNIRLGGNVSVNVVGANINNQSAGQVAFDDWSPSRNGTNIPTQIKLIGGQASGSLLRLDANTNVGVVTIGANIGWDGTTLSATGGSGSGETNYNGEASVTNATMFGWVFDHISGSAGTNRLRSISPGYGLTATNQGTNIAFAVLPIFQPGSTTLSNAAGTGVITNLFTPSLSNASIKPLVFGSVGNAAGATNTTGQIYGLEAGANVTLTPNGSNYVVAASGGAGTPGGNSGAIQFNETGAFAGTNADIYFDRTNRLFRVSGNIESTAGVLNVPQANVTNGVIATNVQAFNVIIPPVKDLTAGTITIPVSSSNAMHTTISTNANFTVSFSGTPQQGKRVLLTVTNSAIGTDLTATIPSSYDFDSASVITSVTIKSNSWTTLHWLAMTNFTAGTVIWYIEERDGMSYTISGSGTILFTTNLLNIGLDIPSSVSLTNATNYGQTTITNHTIRARTGDAEPSLTFLASNGNAYVKLLTTSSNLFTNIVALNLGVPAVGEVLKVHSVSGQTAIWTNGADATGAGSLATNANQFGASVTLTIKDNAQLTNAVSWSNAIVAGIIGKGAPILKLQQTNGNAFNGFTAPDNWLPTNLFSLSFTNVVAGQVIKVSSVSISGGIATIILTNDVDNSSGGIQTNANQFGASVIITIKDGALLTNANNFGTFNLTNGAGGASPILTIHGTNGNSGLSFNLRDAATTTNTVQWDLGVPAANDVLTVHSVSGQTAILTNKQPAAAGSSNFVVSSQGNIDLTNQIIYRATQFGGSATSQQIDFSLSTRWVITNQLNTNVTLWLTNAADGKSAVVEVPANTLGTNFNIIVSVAAGSTSTNIKWLSPTNGNYEFTAQTNATYFLSFLVDSTLVATNIIASWTTTTGNPVRNLPIQTAAGASASNAFPAGLLFKTVAIPAFTNLNTTIATFTNGAQCIIGAHTLTNNGDSHITVWRGNFLAGTNSIKLIYGYDTVLSTGSFTNANTAFEAGMEITRTGSVGAHADAWVRFAPISPALTVANDTGFYADVELSCTNGTAVTNVIQLASNRAGAVSNNFMRVTFEPGPR